MKRTKVGQALTGLAWVLFHFDSASAGSFAVSPVRVTLTPSQSVAAIRVQNEGTEATVVQLETYDWSQHDGENVLTATNELLATPPILTIPPGGSRVIRVGLRRSRDAQREVTYRLMLREVPPPDPIAQSLRVALQISMPVFVLPAGPTSPDVHWRAALTDDGHIRVLAKNTGSAHIQLGHLELAPAGGAAVAAQDMSTYILPDNGHEWTLPVSSLPAVGTLLRVTSQLESSKLQADVRLEESAGGARSAANGH
ncbi:MAG: fimbrial chaperone protein [Gammaproteobacteria bacterium]|jgi:fimbrial chaperone protein|nr:fimbrial chaperone protein [Gammaproteobacteria bacterium]